MLTDEWFPLKYVPEQAALWRCHRRFAAVAAGRGSGKTLLARRRVVRYLPVRKPWNDARYFYALPTYLQAKRVAWDKLKALVPRDWLACKPSESELRITTVFGSELWLVGMDNPARIEGVQWDGGVLDESCDQRPRVFDVSVRPALSHRDGWCWRIGAVKMHGPGAAEFKEFFDRGMSGEDPDVAAFTWESERVLPPEELEAARRQLDPRTYDSQYRAKWQDATGLVYPDFGAENIDEAVAHRPGECLIVGSDFNVDPMAWTLGHRVGDEYHVFDELWLRNTTTQRSLDHLHSRYESHRGGWLFIGDASGKSRNTRASESDYQQIRGDRRFQPKVVKYPDSNPAVVDRIAAVNAVIKNALGARRLRVHPRCVNLIKDLKSLAYVEGTRIPDGGGDRGHITDALGYPLYVLYPLVARAQEIKIG